MSTESFWPFKAPTERITAKFILAARKAMGSRGAVNCALSEDALQQVHASIKTVKDVSKLRGRVAFISDPYPMRHDFVRGKWVQRVHGTIEHHNAAYENAVLIDSKSGKKCVLRFCRCALLTEDTKCW